ncbi:MAG: hypothetical protein IPL47_08455 [Phyllobacteriaceae bacterium]|nr:hypothetical protein [Phyllobacteriaceae bacterium]
MRFGRGGDLNEVDPITGRRIDRAAETPQTIMQREMAPGEKLIWAGRPTNAGSFGRPLLAQAIFGIPFLAFALFWTGMAATMTNASPDTPWFFRYVFPAFGIPFIVVGISLVSGPLRARWRARRVVYGLTDRRLIIREDDYVQSFAFDQIQMIKRRDNRDGTGDVVFREETRRLSRGSRSESIGFHGIAEPQKVEQAIRAAREAVKMEGSHG